MPYLNKVVFTGDPQQLINYVEDIPQIVRPFGTQSLLSHLPLLDSERIRTVILRETYRFHPELAECIAATGYGKNLVPAVSRDARSMVTGADLKLPTPSFPIMLFHQEDEDVRDPNSFSRHNIAQADNAVDILLRLLARLPEHATVAVLCLYTAEKERMKERLRALGINSVKVSSVDGYQANEADIVYLLTTRSISASDSKTSLEFIQNDRRATVAISRARHGVILHGNLKTLSTGLVWRLFILYALGKTEALDPDSYLKMWRDGIPSKPISLPLWTLDGAPPTSRIHYQREWRNRTMPPLPESLGRPSILPPQGPCSSKDTPPGIEGSFD